MQTFYNVLEKIKAQLQADKFCNTVTTGDIFDVDLKKKTIFPLSHIIVNDATLEGNTWRFSLSVLSMDIVDVSKDLTTDNFRGNNNEHDILNTQLAVQNRMLDVLRKGEDSGSVYQIDGDPICEPFFDRFENILAGWTASFDLLLPNDMTICDNDIIQYCADGTATNSNSSYSLTVPSGLDVEIPDTTFDVYLDGEFSGTVTVPTLSGEDINIILT